MFSLPKKYLKDQRGSIGLLLALLVVGLLSVNLYFYSKNNQVTPIKTASVEEVTLPDDFITEEEWLSLNPEDEVLGTIANTRVVNQTGELKGRVQGRRNSGPEGIGSSIKIEAVNSSTIPVYTKNLVTSKPNGNAYSTGNNYPVGSYIKVTASAPPGYKAKFSICNNCIKHPDSSFARYGNSFLLPIPRKPDNYANAFIDLHWRFEPDSTIESRIFTVKGKRIEGPSNTLSSVFIEEDTYNMGKYVSGHYMYKTGDTFSTGKGFKKASRVKITPYFSNSKYQTYYTYCNSCLTPPYKTLRKWTSPVTFNIPNRDVGENYLNINISHVDRDIRELR